ncbi:MAG: cyclic nucleotide-binding domain-containing protein [Acidobacteria bacterium]|nr:cyclic nucleotide-binding domain-containing protein [Acidobacteriota bacterium]MDW7983798.1 cyclic nucleotide-binding domain-containing protein [Acidobacteriota bacterium]
MTDEAPEISDWPDVLQQHLSLQDFVRIAERLVLQHRYDEAIALFEAALRLYPDSLALRLNQARVRDLKRRQEEKQTEQLRTEWERHRRESDLVAQHFVSLARVYIQRGQPLKALELLELARHLNAQWAEIYWLQAQVYYDQMDYRRALGALEEAQRLDPFRAEVAYFFAKVYRELGDTEKALSAAVDAYVLAGGEQSHLRELYTRLIRSLAERLGQTPDDLQDVFLRRKAYFNQMVEQLVLKRDQMMFEVGPTEMDLWLFQWPRLQKTRQGVLGLAVELRRWLPFQAMTDDQVFEIARTGRWVEVESGFVLFPEDQPLSTLWVLLEGRVRLVRDTPYGQLTLAWVEPGEILGETEFIDGLPTVVRAEAALPGRLLALPHAGLEEVMARDRYLSVQVYWYFWKLLARRIRQANERAERFFQRLFAAGPAEAPAPQRPRAVAEVARVSDTQKMELFREQGLSASELQLLTTFSQEERFRQGEAIFREGDPGDRLYIVLDGQVRISKLIPGVGEEALVILNRGEFFGEMALVDGAPRSADAIAHSETATVLAIDQRVLADILSRDPESALRFLRILGRVLSRRLRETYLRIYHWHCMAGARVEEE